MTKFRVSGNLTSDKAKPRVLAAKPIFSSAPLPEKKSVMKVLGKLKAIWGNPKRRIYFLLTLYICALPVGVVGFYFSEYDIDTDKMRFINGLLLTLQTMTFSTTGEIVPRFLTGRIVAVIVKINSLFCVGAALYAALQAALFDRVEKITEARIRQIQKKPINIFLSYRSLDSAGHTGRLYDRLAAFFGPDHVSMNLDSTTAGEEVPHVLEEKISACNILIAVIGPNWLGKEPAKGLIFEENDHVSWEIRHAIQQKLPIIPVLINEAQMPSLAELPEDIRGILRKHAHELSDVRWNADVQKLIDLIDTIRRRI